jgi:hypothetical protein
MDAKQEKAANKYDLIRKKVKAENEAKRKRINDFGDIFNRQTGDKLNRLKGDNK